MNVGGTLPTGWRWTTMGDIAEVVGGGTPRTSEPKNFEGGSIAWLTPADLSGYSEKYVSHGSRFITERGLGSSSARLLPEGTVMFTSRAPIGYAAIARNPIATNQGFKSFVLRPGVLPDYVYWWLKGAKQLAESMASGTTFLELSGAKAKQLPIPIAPIEDQRRIVAEIEKQFSRLDEAVANLKRVKANLKRYKAAVLKAAVEGRLVPTEAELARGEGRSYETGAQLLQRILEIRHSQWKGKGKYKEPTAPNLAELPELPEGWTWATWDEIGFSQNGRPFPSSDYCEEGIKLLRPGNLHESGKLEWTGKNTRIMPARYADENRDLIVTSGELVMNLTAQSLKDEFLGRVCITGLGEHCLLNQRLARLTPMLIPSEFVFVVLKSSWFRQFVSSLNTGSLIQHMFTSQLATFAFPLPPAAEQCRMVAEVDSRFSITGRQEREVDASLCRCESLRQSMLRNAFSSSEGRAPK